MGVSERAPSEPGGVVKPALAAALEAREQLLAALDHLDAAVQEQIADVLMGGLPDPNLSPSIASRVRDRRNQLYRALRELSDELSEGAWADAVKARDRWRKAS